MNITEMFTEASKLVQFIGKLVIFLTFFAVLWLLTSLLWSPHRATTQDRVDRLELEYLKDPISGQCYVMSQWEGIASIPCNSIPSWIEIKEMPKQVERLHNMQVQ